MGFNVPRLHVTFVIVIVQIGLSKPNSSCRFYFHKITWCNMVMARVGKSHTKMMVMVIILFRGQKL